MQSAEILNFGKLYLNDSVLTQVVGGDSAWQKASKKEKAAVVAISVVGGLVCTVLLAGVITIPCLTMFSLRGKTVRAN